MRFYVYVVSVVLGNSFEKAERTVTHPLNVSDERPLCFTPGSRLLHPANSKDRPQTREGSLGAVLLFHLRAVSYNNCRFLLYLRFLGAESCTRALEDCLAISDVLEAVVEL
jgi:hypothetical protein